MIAAFKAGSIDLAMDLNDGDIPSLTGIPTDQVMIHDSLTYELHAFNNASFKKKFGDDYATIIKAIKLTTDRAAIIAGPRQGNATPTNNFISPLTWYYKDEGPQPPADPATAASILAQAGWTAGSDGILTKNGVKLEVQYCTTKLQIRGDTLALVASQLKKVGIQADVLQVPAQPDYFGGWNSVANDTKCNLVHGNFDVAEFAYISPLDPLGGYSVYHSSGIPDAPPHNGQNITRISLPALDAAYDAVKNNVDYSKVRDAMYQVQDIYGSDQNTFELPLFYRKDVWLVNPKLQNFVGNPSSVSGEWNVGDWWLQK
jgi:peptide/nickel transport system substrate-binding protein